VVVKKLIYVASRFSDEISNCRLLSDFQAIREPDEEVDRIVEVVGVSVQ
jgi:hypothetical protein